jgi:hypothetical protein
MDERRQQQIRRAALLIGASSVACLALLVVAIALRPPRFSTHREAIGYALARQGVDVQEIYINHSWPDTVNSERYAANLDVRVTGRPPVVGMLACQSGRQACSFSLQGLGITNEPLPDLVQARSQGWLSWIEQAIGGLVKL